MLADEPCHRQREPRRPEMELSQRILYPLLYWFARLNDGRDPKPRHPHHNRAWTGSVARLLTMTSCSLTLSAWSSVVELIEPVPVNRKQMRIDSQIEQRSRWRIARSGFLSVVEYERIPRGCLVWSGLIFFNVHQESIQRSRRQRIPSVLAPRWRWRWTIAAGWHASVEFVYCASRSRWRSCNG